MSWQRARRRPEVGAAALGVDVCVDAIEICGALGSVSALLACWARVGRGWAVEKARRAELLVSVAHLRASLLFVCERAGLSSVEVRDWERKLLQGFARDGAGARDLTWWALMGAEGVARAVPMFVRLSMAAGRIEKCEQDMVWQLTEAVAFVRAVTLAMCEVLGLSRHELVAEEQAKAADLRNRQYTVRTDR